MRKFDSDELFSSLDLGGNMQLKRFFKLTLTATVCAITVGCGSSSDTVAQSATQNAAPIVAPAAVYTMTNDATANSIREFRRNSNGTLSFVADYPTGANGSGDSLSGSSNGVVFSANTNRFYTVNAGSNSLTAMTLGGDGALTVLSTVNSGGIRPISVAAFNDIVYVLNEGDAGNNVPANISGFQVVGSQLQPIDNSTQALSAANPNPAQIEFTPSGTILVVTERGTNNITTFALAASGAIGPAQVQAAAGVTPFGFDFTPAGILIVSEANGGNVNASTASSYNVGVAGVVTTVSSAVPNGQSAACWVEVARNAPYAYVANTESNNVSIYNVDATGALTLVGNGDNASTGNGPIDLDISNDSLYLYVLNRDDDSISAYQIGSDGNLTPITGVAGLPANSVGLVAR